MPNFLKSWVVTFSSVAVRLILTTTVGLWFAAQSEVRGFPQTQTLPEYSDPEGYAVLSTLLSRGHSAKGPVLFINPHTLPGLRFDSFESCKNIPAEFKTAARDFEVRNKHPWKLLRGFNLPFEYEIADPSKKPPDPPLIPGEQPLDVPPPPVYVVSAVGFNRTHDHALAYFAGFAGPMAASGGYYLLVKNKYGWRQADASPVCEWMTYNLYTTVGRRSA